MDVVKLSLPLCRLLTVVQLKELLLAILEQYQGPFWAHNIYHMPFQSTLTSRFNVMSGHPAATLVIADQVSVTISPWRG